MEKQTIKLSSYSKSLPKNNCKVKVAIKPSNDTWLRNNSNWFTNNTAMKMYVIEEVLYEDGFVSMDNGETYVLASNFIFHKLKRQNI